MGGWRGGGRHGDRDAVALDILEELGFERDSRVPHQLAGTLGLSFGLFDRLVIYAGLPITFMMDGASQDDLTAIGLNNTATAVIAAPIGVEIASRLGVSPDPFLMGVAVAASCRKIVTVEIGLLSPN